MNMLGKVQQAGQVRRLQPDTHLNYFRYAGGTVAGDPHPPPP
jgi:hypothetical protein